MEVPASVDGEATVVRPQDADQTEGANGAVRVRVPLRTPHLLQRILRYAPGAADEPSAALRRGEDVLYVAAGAGLLSAADGSSFHLRPGTAVLVPAPLTYRVGNPGPGELVLVSVVSPPPWEEGPEDPPGRGARDTHSDDEQRLPAGEDRSFKLLVDPRYGARHVTQFVGFIERSRAPFHTHTYEEAIYILGGQGMVHIGGRSLPIGPGSSVFLPPGTPHCLENASHGVLELLGVFSPAGSPADRMDHPTG